MNTMVGMQTSLHTSVSEDVSGTMKNSSEIMIRSDNDISDLFESDVFDPDELLKSPLFNDSGKEETVINKTIPGDNQLLFSGGFNQINMQQQGTMSGFSPEVSVEHSSSTSGVQLESHDYTMKPMNSYNTRQMFGSVKRSVSANNAPLPAQAALHQAQQIFNNQHQAQQMLLQQQQQQPPPPSRAPVRRAASAISAFGRGNMSQLGQMQAALAKENDIGRNLSSLPQIPQGHLANQNQPLSQSLHGVSFQRSQPVEIQQNNQVNNIDPLLAQSMHTGFVGHFNNNNVQITSDMHLNKSNNLSGGGMMASAGQMNGQMNGMMANNQMNQQALNGNVNGMVGFDIQNASSAPSPGQKPASLNEAMEKLCGSMKRSAMSRSLVKQLSSRGVPKQNSRNNLSRQNSGVGRNNSGHLMMGKQFSNRSLIDDNSGRGSAPTPLRRVASVKHTLQHPSSRGVYRHTSNESLPGQTGLSLQIDGRNMGTF